MTKYISIRGGAQPVEFDTAVLEGFAADGGLYVPEKIPELSMKKLKHLSTLTYPRVALEVIRPFIGRHIIPEQDLETLVEKSFEAFRHPDVLPVKPINPEKNIHCMELFYGPTLSFKDIAMGFLINTMDYLLKKKNKHLSIILATTGDTGPAAAFAAAGKSTIDCWPLYPEGMISEEQERQMTALSASNIHPVGVENCPDGGDNLDVVVARMFSSEKLKERLHLSSVNSINWCRVMFQAAHYVYGYLKTCGTIGETVRFSVPSGAFGNLFAGFLAREMGVPITFICANNENRTLHRAFSRGVFRKEALQQTVSSAIDIVVPYNFWRFIYFAANGDHGRVREWMDAFEAEGEIKLPDDVMKKIRKGFVSIGISDEQTLAIMAEYWKQERYLLDPHGAVAVAAAEILESQNGARTKTVCLATAHPAKFPEVVKQALNSPELPDDAAHESIIQARNLEERKSVCGLEDLDDFLAKDIEKQINSKKGK